MLGIISARTSETPNGVRFLLWTLRRWRMRVRLLVVTMETEASGSDDDRYASSKSISCENVR